MSELTLTEFEVLTSHTDVICSTSIERIVSGRNTAIAQIETLIQQLDDICKQHASVYEDEYVEIRYFQKGTGHIIFKRSDLIDKMNGIVARHFPATLPPRT